LIILIMDKLYNRHDYLWIDFRDLQTMNRLLNCICRTVRTFPHEFLVAWYSELMFQCTEISCFSQIHCLGTLVSMVTFFTITLVNMLSMCYHGYHILGVSVTSQMCLSRSLQLLIIRN
jgi:hypothetical protein